MRKIGVRIISLVALVSILVLLLPATTLASDPPKSWPKSIQIGSGSIGSGSFGTATGLAALITRYTGVKAVAEVSTFGKNIVLLHKGEIEFGQAQSDIVYEGSRGIGITRNMGK